MNNTDSKKGGISVEVEHIFPIIKKWLYSEKEIFAREIVSNACDAVTKLRRLVSLGEIKDITDDGWKIRVLLDPDEKTISVVDDGIGMDEDEVKKYICQIALSGALDFIEKYESSDSSDASGSGIIGHFGLGFYSSFMVSETVDVITKSYHSDLPVKWTCNDSGEYEIESPSEDEISLIGNHGTAVVMHINSEGEEYLDSSKLKSILEKYCRFMPVEIYFEDQSEESDNNEKTENKPINDTTPLWMKNPSDCTDEDYKDFYHKLFGDYREPLFWIHLRADYPLNFKGILYFPRITNEYESLEGQVKLYYNQVFVADNIKEVIPEYLLMLKGVLDCPELPLNVSRSYLQNSGYVSKISAHIVKKVADKLNSMFNLDREKFEGIWRDIKTFVEYGCLRDRKFYDKVRQSLLFENTDGKFTTLEEYLGKAKEKNHEGKIYYANDKTAQSQYITLLANEGISVVLLDKILDTQFIQSIENNDGNVKFVRVDADAGEISSGEGEKNQKLDELFKGIAGEKTEISFECLKDTSVPAILTISEESRRFDDMMKLYSMSDANTYPVEMKLIINSENSLIKKLADVSESDSEKADMIARQIYSLCLLSNRKLTSDELGDLLQRSYDILEKI